MVLNSREKKVDEDEKRKRYLHAETLFLFILSLSSKHHLPSQKKPKGDDIGNLSRLLCERLCNSNRYGKDKTVVIAMGRGKRQNMFLVGLNAKIIQLPVCEKIRNMGKRGETIQLCVRRRTMESPKTTHSKNASVVNIKQ